MTAKPLMTYATGNTRTIVTEPFPGRFVWRRTAGSRRARPMSVPAEGELRAFAEAGSDQVSFVVPRLDGGDLVYELPAPVSIGWRVLLANSDPATFDDHLRNAGRALRRLHRLAPPPGSGAPIPWLVRFSRWLETGEGPGDSSFLHTAAATKLGKARWDELGGWCSDITTTSGRAGLVHGTFSVGMMVAGIGDGRCLILTGSGVGRGPGSFDVGSFLGDFHDLRMTASRNLIPELPKVAYEVLVRPFLDGYGPIPDRSVVGRVATMHCLSRLDGVASFVGWDDDLLRSLDALPDLIDSSGEAALQW